MEVLHAAVQTVQRMLSGPLWTSGDAEDPGLLEILQAKKKRFSTVSGCWLKFDWVNNIISFYGLNRPVALDFIERARKQLANKKAQEKIQEEQQAQEKAKLERQAYDLGVLRLKEYVHEKSGCQVIVQDDPSGRTVIQLSGTDAECQRAQQMIPQLLQNSSLSDDRQLAFPPANLQLPAAKKFGNEITMDVNLAVPPRSMQLPKKQPQPAEEHTPFPPRNLQLPVREEKEDVAGREEYDLGMLRFREYVQGRSCQSPVDADSTPRNFIQVPGSDDRFKIEQLPSPIRPSVTSDNEAFPPRNLSLPGSLSNKISSNKIGVPIDSESNVPRAFSLTSYPLPASQRPGQSHSALSLSSCYSAPPVPTPAKSQSTTSLASFHSAAPRFTSVTADPLPDSASNTSLSQLQQTLQSHSELSLASSCDKRSVPQSVGYDDASVEGVSPPATESQGDALMDIAQKVLAKESNIDWVIDVLYRMAETRVDPLQVVEFLEVHRGLQSLF
uniref:Uncharacterized protein n=1 Tax=Eutreptiella gymnastica TaxID=73025 RepID=A0A7S4LAB3_9EUGL